MPDIDVRISGGIFLLSLTYWSNCASSARRIASTSCAVPGSPAIGCRLRGQVLAVSSMLCDARALRALDQHLHRAVGQLQHLQHRRDAADVVEVLGGRVVLRGLLLRDEQDVLAGVHRHVERLDRLRASDEQRDHHVREHDDVAQRQQRQRRDVGREGSVVGHACLR